MNRGAKRINPNQRAIIDTLKNNMRFSNKPFDGTGYAFKQALKELRSEGVEIIYNAKKCHYYNKNTIAKIWGYS